MSDKHWQAAPEDEAAGHNQTAENNLTEQASAESAENMTAGAEKVAVNADAEEKNCGQPKSGG
ncbi:hypothetical protein [Aliamphritea spongicola]|nr:hypothetical protein [Aliamphritea spongicola]